MIGPFGEPTGNAYVPLAEWPVDTNGQAPTGAIEQSFFSGKTPVENKIWIEFKQSKKSIFDNLLIKFLPSNKLRDYYAVLLQIIKKRVKLNIKTVYLIYQVM